MAAIIALGFGYGGYRVLSPIVLLQSRGIEATATVVAYEDVGRISTSALRFTDRQGRPWTVEIEGDTAEVGRQVQILYDPEDPTTVDLANPVRWEPGRVFFAVVAIFLMLSGLLSLGRAGFRRRRRRESERA